MNKNKDQFLDDIGFYDMQLSHNSISNNISRICDSEVFENILKNLPSKKLPTMPIQQLCSVQPMPRIEWIGTKRTDFHFLYPPPSQCDGKDAMMFANMRGFEDRYLGNLDAVIKLNVNSRVSYLLFEKNTDATVCIHIVEYGTFKKLYTKTTGILTARGIWRDFTKKAGWRTKI